MRNLLIIPLIILSNSLLAQTKEIAFKSHSGNMINFKIALNNDLFDTEESNFGLPAEKKTYKLDSVIYISDSATIIVTSVYSRPYRDPQDSAKLVQIAKDTLYNDVFFNRKHSLDSIKNELKKNGKYMNPVNKVVFVGYDNNKHSKKEKEKENGLPLALPGSNNNNNPPFDSQLILILGFIVTVSLLGGWLSWKIYQPRLQKA